MKYFLDKRPKTMGESFTDDPLTGCVSASISFSLSQEAFGIGNLAYSFW